MLVWPFARGGRHRSRRDVQPLGVVLPLPVRLGDAQELLRVGACALAELVGAAVVSGFGAYSYFPAEHPQRVGARYAGDQPYPFGSADLVVQCGTRDMGADEYVAP